MHRKRLVSTLDSDSNEEVGEVQVCGESHVSDDMEVISNEQVVTEEKTKKVVCSDYIIES